LYYHDSGNSRSFYERIPIALDGHCQFRAALHCANDGDHDATSDEAVNELRHIVAKAGEKEGKEKSARYQQWVEAEVGEERSEREREVATYWQEVRSGKSWGDHRCLPLLATHFNIPIYVYKPQTSKQDNQSACPLRAFPLTHHLLEPVLPDGFDSSKLTPITINLLWIDNERKEEIKHQGHYDALIHLVTVDLLTDNESPASSSIFTHLSTSSLPSAPLPNKTSSPTAVDATVMPSR
jgi:hypothetical protein